MRPFTIASFVSTALAATVTIQNNCGTPILWKNDLPSFSDAPSLLSVGDATSVYVSGPGSAIKFSSSSDFSQPISFDLSITDQAYYDVSDKAGHPIDVFATPSLPCPLVSCPAGPTSPCSYTEACSVYSDYQVDLCFPSAMRKKREYLVPRRPAAAMDKQ